MKNSENADSKQIAGTTGAYSTKVESFNLDGHQFTGIVLAFKHISGISPCAWIVEMLVYSKEEGVLLKIQESHKHDANGSIVEPISHTVVAFGDLTFNEEA